MNFGGSSTALNNPAEQVKPISGDRLMAMVPGADPMSRVMR